MSGAVATARPTQALRVRRESQRPGVARVVNKTNNMEEDSAKPEPKLYGMQPATSFRASTQLLTQSTVYTQEAILARHRGKLPSMRVYLYPNHFRINDSQETLTYASPMRELLTALRTKTLPHNMLEELYANGTPFYDGCLIVEVHNYRNNTAKPKDSVNGAGDGNKTAFSIHNNNNFITPSPYGVHPNNKPDPKANATAAQTKEAGDKEDKENMPAPGTNGASQKQPASGPKIATVVLFPSTQAQLSDLSILATTPATDVAALKRMQAAGRGGMPPTPLTAVPPTPTFSAGPSPKRQKMMIDDGNVHEFEAELLNATCPKLYLEPTKSFAESVALIDAMTHPNNKNSPPERKTRKRTTAELAADEAEAQSLQSFMLAGDEQQATLNTTTAGGDDGAVRAAANTMSFARFKTLATIKANHEEQERRKKEEDARQAQAKRQAQIESEAQKRRDMEANRQQAEVQERQQQMLARQQAQQQMLQQNQIQQNEALRAAQAAQMSSAAAPQISQTPQSATQNQFSPSVRQNTPMAAAAASPRVGGQASHPMGGTPMVATASNHAIASPARPPSSISHHPMARTASQQQGSMSRTNTPQMMQGTPVMNSAMPNRNMTPTPRMNQGSPSLQVQGATPIMMQTPQSQNMTPEQMHALQQQQQTQQRMQQIRLQQLQNQQNQQMNGMSPGGQNLQQMALQKAQLHVQAQGIPNGQNPQIFQQQLAQRYFQQLKQAQAAQAQQQQQNHGMGQMSPQGPQTGMPQQQAGNNMANMNVAQLRAHYQQRKQQLLQTFGQQVPQQHVQQMQQLEQLIRSKEQAQMQAQQQMGQNQMPMNQGMQGQMGGGQNPMQMQQYQQALLQQRAQQQRNDQLMRMRQQAMQQGGQMPQGMMNNMQGMNMGNMGQMNMGNMQGMNMQNMQGMQGMQGMNMGQMNQQQMQQMMMMRQAQQQQQQRMQQQGGGDMNWSGV